MLAVVVVTLLIQNANTANEISKTEQEKLSRLANSMANSELMQWDNTDCRGFDLIGFLGNHLKQWDHAYNEANDFDIHLYYKNAPKSINDTSYVNNLYIDDFGTEGNERYISPHSKWHCKVNISANNVLISIDFTQQ